MTKWWKSIILASFLSLIGGLIYYGFTERAIIEYWLEAPDTFSIQPNPYLEVKLKFGNKGNTDASVTLRITVENATILNDTIKFPHQLISNSIAEFYYAAVKNREGEQIVHIIPKNDTTTFRILYTVEKRFFFSSSELLSWIFGEVKGYYPTSLTYKKIDSATYQMITS